MTDFSTTANALNMLVELVGVIFLFHAVEKRDERWRIFPGVFCLLLLLMLIYIPIIPWINSTHNYSTENLFNQILRTGLNFLAVFSYLLFCKDKRASVCGYLAAIYILVYMVSFNLRQAFMPFLFGTDFRAAQWKMLFALVLIQWAAVYAVYRLVDLDSIQKVTAARWASVLIPITIELYFKWSLISPDGNPQRIFDTVFYTLCATLGVLIMVILLERNIAAQQKHTEMVLEQVQLQYEMQNAKRALRANTDIRRLYHDMKNHMLALQAMIDTEGSPSDASEYLSELCTQLEEYEVNIHTGNTVADALLAEKMERARLDNIRFNVCVDLSPLDFMHNIDIVTILGNASDNAVEALQMMPEGQERIVYFKSACYANMLVLRISNQYHGQLSVRNGILQTLKSNTDMHGIGLKSIEKAVKRYNGNVETQFDNDGNWFRLILMIPIPPKGEDTSA